MQAMVCLCRTAYNRVGTHSHGDSRSEFEKHGIGCRCIDCWKNYGDFIVTNATGPQVDGVGLAQKEEFAADATVKLT